VKELAGNGRHRAPASVKHEGTQADLERLSARRTQWPNMAAPCRPDATALKAIRARLCLLRVVAHPVVPFHKVPIVLGIEHGALKIRTGEFGDGFE
jgi:hypothetical protein